MGSNDTEWELEEGIPQVEEPFIQQYLKGRDALVLEERKQRHGPLPAGRQSMQDRVQDPRS